MKSLETDSCIYGNSVKVASQITENPDYSKHCIYTIGYQFK